jgi:8-oxo-dGTP pyrophosphatase MutT (NUDIX family)
MSSIEPLLIQLQRYIPYNTTESNHLDRICSFLQNTTKPFHRETLEGHITGSAIVVDSTYQHILLLHHRKLDRWLQPGGHCDGNPDPLAVAMQEVKEETGLSTVISVNQTVFDIDVHRIPLKGIVPEHWHYDIRYLFVADPEEDFQHSEQEVIALQWFPLDQLDIVVSDESLHRVREKLISKPRSYSQSLH